jgi:hypothetical protein
LNKPRRKQTTLNHVVIITGASTRGRPPRPRPFFYATRLRGLCEANHDPGYELMLRASEIIKRLRAARRELVEYKRMVPALVSRA